MCVKDPWAPRYTLFSFQTNVSMENGHFGSGVESIDCEFCNFLVSWNDAKS